MKIAILGNGAIGTTVALKLTEKGHKVDLFGTNDRKGGASKAAGAMINCLAEIEQGQFENEILKKRFELTYNSYKKWDSFIKKYFNNIYNTYKKRGTVIISNSFTTPYEKESIDYLKKNIARFKKEIRISTKKK